MIENKLYVQQNLSKVIDDIFTKANTKKII